MEDEQMNFEQKTTDIMMLVTNQSKGLQSISAAITEALREAYRQGFEAGAEQMKRRAAKICADSAAISYENDENTWGALAESYGERIRALSPEEPPRCKHGVWGADHCYQCEKEPKS